MSPWAAAGRGLSPSHWSKGERVAGFPRSLQFLLQRVEGESAEVWACSACLLTPGVVCFVLGKSSYNLMIFKKIFLKNFRCIQIGLFPPREEEFSFFLSSCRMS